MINEKKVSLSDNYHEDAKRRDISKLRELSADLPECARGFLRSLQTTKQSRTLVAYARDLTLFFNWLKEAGHGEPLLVTTEDIEDYMEYLTLYETKVDIRTAKEREAGDSPRYKTVVRTNGAAGKQRKLITIRRLYQWMYKREQIEKDPSAITELPRIPEKPIVALEPNEAADLLDAAETIRKRDLALVSLLLGTGMRVSECVGINIDHLNIEEGQVLVTRKGGHEAILYFSEEVGEALADYIEDRNQEKAGHEKALFLSNRGKRLGVRQIQQLVKKYAALSRIVKKVSPHKLRSTLGTGLYRETGDIYLVASVLGHKDVNTTTKHYAKQDEARLRAASRNVRLRRD